MKAFRKKLNSRNGASMLVALVFLLVSLVLGAVALTAASVNAGRAGRNAREQQIYYAINSAAELIEADMSTASFTASSYTTTVEQWDTDEFVNRRESSGVGFDVDPVCRLLYALRSEIAGFYTAPALPAVTETAVIPISFSAQEGLPEVEGTLTLYKGGGKDYTVLVELYISDGDGRSGGMTLSFPPYVDGGEERSESTVNGTRTVTVTKTAAVSWGEPEVTKG